MGATVVSKSIDLSFRWWTSIVDGVQSMGVVGVVGGGMGGEIGSWCRA